MHNVATGFSEYGSDQMVEDVNDLDVKAQAKWLDSSRVCNLHGNCPCKFIQVFKYCENVFI